MTVPAASNEEEEEIEVQGTGDDNNNENKKRRFPDPFYDGATGKLMTDPVVDPAGDSHEKSSIASSSTAADAYYPNRALKTIIEREVELGEQTWKGSVRRWDQAMQAGWGRLVNQSAFGTLMDYRPLPESFYCPITCELMTDPVISKYGVTYERGAIENWIRVNHQSPMTRNPLAATDLRENNALYELIQIEKGRTDESIHPSIRRWKESGDPTSRRPVAPSTSGPTAPPGDLDQDVEINVADLPTQVQDLYPTTEEEIEARRREEEQANADATCCILICFTLVVLLFAFPYYFFLVLFILLFTCPIWCPFVYCCCCGCGDGENEE